MSIPYRIGGGMQDNGSWVGPSSIWQQGNIRNTDWQEIYFGDGFDVSFHPTDATKAYAMSQGGNVGQVHLNTGRTQGIKPTHPNPKIELRYNWNAAFAQNPFEPCGLYFGSQFVHKSTDCGKTWEIISPDLTTNDAIKQMQDSTGGLTIDNTAAENHTTILAIAPSPLDKKETMGTNPDTDEPISRKPDYNEPFTALAFKIATDPFVGKLAYFRVFWCRRVT